MARIKASTSSFFIRFLRCGKSGCALDAGDSLGGLFSRGFIGRPFDPGTVVDLDIGVAGFGQDEQGLGGLSRSYLDQASVTVTEPFFDLFPRQPHAFKMLFHVLQAGLIGLLGFNVFAVRLLSLLAALLTLVLVYYGLARWTGRRDLALGWLALSRFWLGSLCIIVGLTVFLAGVDWSVSPMGDQVGEQILRRNSLVLVISAGLFLGFLISIAEPDLHILASQVSLVKG